MRGQVYQIEGKRLFVFGGAYSIDRAYRDLGFTWFKEELPLAEEYEEAWDRLNRRYYDASIDLHKNYEEVAGIGAN